MEEDPEDPTLDVTAAIGIASFYWTRIESSVHTLCFQLLTTLDPDFRPQHVLTPSAIMLASMDHRQRMAVAKVLAHRIKNTSSFYTRLKQHFNHIDNELRPLRNRYIHDEWSIEEGAIERIQYKPVVKDTDTKGPTPNGVFLRYANVKTYDSTDELYEFAEQVKAAYSTLEDFRNELQAISDKLDKQPLSDRRIEWFS